MSLPVVLVALSAFSCMPPADYRGDPSALICISDSRPASPVLAATMARALHSPKKSVRLEAVRKLSGERLTFAPATNALIAALEDKDAAVRVLARKSLAYRAMEDPSTVLHLIRGLKSRSSDLQVFALETLSEIRVTRASVAYRFLPLLNSPHPKVRIAALRSYDRVGLAGEPYRNALRRLLKDTDDSVRGNAAEVYVEYRPDDPAPPVPILLERVQNPLAADRGMAAIALWKVRGRIQQNPKVAGGIQDSDIVTALLPLTRDTDAQARQNAVMALYANDSSDINVLKVMVERLDDEQTSIRGMALQFLSNTRHDITPYRENLLSLLRREVQKERQRPRTSAGTNRGQAEVIRTLGRRFGSDPSVKAAFLDLLRAVPGSDSTGGAGGLSDSGFDALLAARGRYPEFVDPFWAWSQKQSEHTRGRTLGALLEAQRDHPETFDTLIGIYRAQSPEVQQATVSSFAHSAEYGQVMRSESDSSVPVDHLIVSPRPERDPKTDTGFLWLVSLLKDPRPGIRDLALTAVIAAKVSDGRNLIEVSSFLDHPDKRVRFNTLQMLLIELTSATPFSGNSIPREMSDAEIDVRCRAITDVSARLRSLRDTKSVDSMYSDARTSTRWLKRLEESLQRLTAEQKRRQGVSTISLPGGT